MGSDNRPCLGIITCQSSTSNSFHLSSESKFSNWGSTTSHESFFENLGLAWVIVCCSRLAVEGSCCWFVTAGKTPTELERYAVSFSRFFSLPSCWFSGIYFDFALNRSGAYNSWKARLDDVLLAPHYPTSQLLRASISLYVSFFLSFPLSR